MAVKSAAEKKTSSKSAGKSGTEVIAKNATTSGAGKPVAEIRDGAVYIMQPGTKVYLKTADVCAMSGKTKQWIGQLTAQGVLSKVQTARGSLYELHDTVESYLRNIEDRRDAVNEKEADLKKKQLAAEVSMKQSKALIAALDAKERQGKMHRSEDVAAMTEDLIYAIRGALLALPGRLAVDVLEAETAAEASEIIRKEVYQVMEELSGYEYDPAKYEERMRDRLNLASVAGEDE